MKSKKIVLLLFLIILITGCTNKTSSNTLIVECNEKTTKYDIKKDTKLKCNLLGEDYIFKIRTINKNKLSIIVNEYGLTDSSSLLEKKKKFVITKNKELKLHTQSTDYQESIKFILE